MSLTKSIVRRPFHKIILHFDYDCFYASCYAASNPKLQTLPLGVQQKSILATCNYVARARGVKKLMLLSEAQKICPDLVVVNGEDLTLFRDTSKQIYNFLRAHSWNDRVERLGLDEVYLDVTDIIEYNLELLNHSNPSGSFFHFCQQDPWKGFPFDCSKLSGHAYPLPLLNQTPESGTTTTGPQLNPHFLRLLIASHFASYLRKQIEEQFNLTASCGISTNKLLSKLVGSYKKPNQQTTLFVDDEPSVLAFIGAFELRKVPGIGSKVTLALEAYCSRSQLGCSTSAVNDPHILTVKDVRQHPGLSVRTLAAIVEGPGAEKGLGLKIWSYLHGHDPSDVKPATDVPTQLSVEDTYHSTGLSELADVLSQLHILTYSLIRRMHGELLTHSGTRWLAHPKTIRLTTNCRRAKDPDSAYWAGRTSRSMPLPTFVFNLKMPPEEIVARLVKDILLPMFRRLHPAKQGWDLSLINICVANIVVSGTASGAERDITTMFKGQDKNLNDIVYDKDDSTIASQPMDSRKLPKEQGCEGSCPVNSCRVCIDKKVGDGYRDEYMGGNLEVEEADDEWEYDEEYSDPGIECPQCSHCFPAFALDAHLRYHEFDD